MDAVARAAAVLLLTVRGTPFLYYGEELGLRDVDIPPDESIDPPAARVGPDFQWWDRSRCRTPMPWSPGPGAGFTTGRPWLRLGPDDGDPQRRGRRRSDPGSVLSVLSPSDRAPGGDPGTPDRRVRDRPGSTGTVVAYTRGTGEGTILVAINVGRDRAHWTLPGDPGSDRLAAAATDRAGARADRWAHGRGSDRHRRRRGGHLRGHRPSVRRTGRTIAPATMTAGSSPDMPGSTTCRSNS